MTTSNRHSDEVFIGGSWVRARSDERINVFNPASGLVIGTVPACGTDDVNRAVGAARVAFDSGAWSGLSGADRARHINRLADCLDARTAEMARMIIDESGMPAMIATSLHVTCGISFLRYFADLAGKFNFEEKRTTANANVLVRKLPVGVVAAIVPWNVPLLGALSKVAPALAAGCTVVLKPSPETPLSAYLLAEAAVEAGLPPGVLNVVAATLEGSKGLSSHPDVDMVGFTGSTSVGRTIAQTCATDFRRCALELGGNAAAIILEDAPAELIASGLGVTGMFNNGEACIAQRRVLAPRSRYDEIVAILAGVAKSLRVGDPHDPNTAIGPMITEAHRDRVLRFIQIGEGEGAKVMAGGGVPKGLGKGYFVEPTLLANVTNHMRVAREEIFGPVICVIPYDDLEEAIAITRDTEYGLSSSIWTANYARGEEIGRGIRVGSFYVNATLTIDADIPFGGFKHSGWGREFGTEGFSEYLEVQSLFVPKS